MAKFTLLALIAAFLVGCNTAALIQQENAKIYAETGLQPQSMDPDGMGGKLTKVHRGYPVIMMTRMGNVWGRYAARLTAGEIGQHVGGIVGFLTGQGDYISNVTGSPFDRVLSRAIGQPLTLVIGLKHNKPGASRLDIISDHSVLTPDDPVPYYSRLGTFEENVRTMNPAFADKLLSNESLRSKLNGFRAEYIRVDPVAVTFMFSGSENDYSGMIREFETCPAFLTAIMDSLADIADSIEGHAVVISPKKLPSNP